MNLFYSMYLIEINGILISNLFDLFRSENYSQRSDSRSVQCVYGSPTAQYKRESTYPISIKNVTENNMANDIKYMYEIMGKKATSLSNMAQYLGHSILEHHGLVLTEGLLKTHVVRFVMVFYLSFKVSIIKFCNIYCQ